jgi:hypothetical protein
MCWIGYDIDKRIAKEDIVVFKAVYKELNKNVYYSPLMGFKYALYKIYKVKALTPKPIIPRSAGRIAINEGLHTFNREELEKAKKFCGHLFISGFHFPIRTTVLYLYGNGKRGQYIEGDLKLAILNCIIPEGTVYYERDGEIVSEKLIITDKEAIDVDSFENIKQHE